MIVVMKTMFLLKKIKSIIHYSVFKNSIRIVSIVVAAAAAAANLLYLLP
jgi:hypothetical protein